MDLIKAGHPIWTALLRHWSAMSETGALRYTACFKQWADFVGVEFYHWDGNLTLDPDPQELLHVDFNQAYAFMHNMSKRLGKAPRIASYSDESSCRALGEVKPAALPHVQTPVSYTHLTLPTNREV